MVKLREQQLGPITVLDGGDSEIIDVTESSLDNVTGVIHSAIAEAPANNSFWVETGSPTSPKFTDSDGYTITIGAPGEPEDHASRHLSGGADEIDGYNLEVVFNPTNYTDATSNLLGQHLFRIDQALASIGASDHGALTGLSDDDHTQYLLVNGTRAMTGSLNMGTFNITNVGTVDSVDISGHASRHLAGGADEIDGYNLEVVFNPTNYTDAASNLLGQHLFRIDQALASVGGNVDVSYEGSLVVDSASVINFIGSAVSVTNLGGGVARVEITAIDSGSEDGYFVQETVTVTNGQTSIILDDAPETYSLSMYLNGMKQQYGTEYTVSGSTVTYSGSVSLLSTDTVEFSYIVGGMPDGYFFQQTETVTNGQTSIILDATPATSESVSMYLNGMKQKYGTEYTVSGSTVTYSGSVSLLSTDTVEFTYIIDGTVSSGVSDHGALTGLSDDDHTQYLLVSGTRAMTGDLNMGAHNISNVGTVDGVDISGHAARHLAGGADEIDGYNLEVVFNPTNYTDATSNLLGQHLFRIDQALASVGASDHGALTGLSDDDHTQYLLVNGTRAMTAALNMGTFNISNVGTVDGVDISGHASRHLAGGADEIDGYNLEVVFNPTNYTDAASNLLGQHLFRIDQALASVGTSDHGGLTGLNDDDHVQYLLVNGTRAMSGDLDLNSNDIVDIKTVTFTAEYDNGNSGTSKTINWNTAQKQRLTLTGNCTLSFTDPLGVGNFVLMVEQDGVGARNIIWPSDTRAQNSVLTLFSTPNSITLFGIYYDVDGYYNVSSLPNLAGSVTTNVIDEFLNVYDHASRHQSGGDDEIDGYQIAIVYNPSHYNDPVNDVLGQHLFRIDQALASIGSSDHGGLTGLNDDDHVQYLLVTGTRPMSGDLDLNNNDIVDIKTVTFTEEYDNGNSGASKTINWNTAQKQKLRLTGDCTLSFTNPIGVGSFVLILKQDGSGNRTITWPAETRAMNSIIEVSADANSETALGIYYDGYYYISSMPGTAGSVTTSLISGYVNSSAVTNVSEYNMGNQAGASLTLNANNGNYQRLTLTGNITSITMTAPTSGVGRFQFKFIQGAGGSKTVTGWPAAVLWPGGTDPTFSTSASDIDVVSLYWDGTNWFGTFSADFS